MVFVEPPGRPPATPRPPTAVQPGATSHAERRCSEGPENVRERSRGRGRHGWRQPQLAGPELVLQMEAGRDKPPSLGPIQAHRGLNVRPFCSSTPPALCSGRNETWKRPSAPGRGGRGRGRGGSGALCSSSRWRWSWPPPAGSRLVLLMSLAKTDLGVPGNQGGSRAAPTGCWEHAL